MKTAVSKSKLNKFKTRLLQQQTELFAREAPPPIEDGSDEVDLAQSLVINDMNERFSLRDKETLTRISQALHRIEHGTFGLCRECEEVIPEKRLEAMPLCVLCVTCAEFDEKRAKQYGR